MHKTMQLRFSNQPQEMLVSLQELGEQVLDLEQFANHRGSSFGGLGKGDQPSSEQFSNNIGMLWATFNRNQVIWIEAEGSAVGSCSVPQEIFKQMQDAQIIIQLLKTKEERIKYIIEVYGAAPPTELVQSTQRIQKRLGAKTTKEVIDCINQGDLETATDLLLKYYDKMYQHVLNNRKGVVYPLNIHNLTALQAAKLAKEYYQQITTQLQQSSSLNSSVCKCSNNNLKFS
eukprot:TRINITY_DN1256_c0_g3_i3.p1 TRINITY_DN1256_c0_g3~~TRINITY_DN1256_c0_g3_i3.p1  ORF type:complete len:230 (-),score=19.50 TRINITY_DN1256_c0_g3_i3:378-1067(-)